MYTANTMASAIEALGLSLPNSSAQEAVSSDKKDDCERAGATVMRMIEMDLKPSDIVTRKSFENAITVITALGGSTNAVLHLIAMAKTAGIDIGLDDFTRIDMAMTITPSDSDTVRINIENLSDETYYPHSHSTHQASVGEPLNVRLSYQKTF